MKQGAIVLDFCSSFKQNFGTAQYLVLKPYECQRNLRGICPTANPRKPAFSEGIPTPKKRLSRYFLIVFQPVLKTPPIILFKSVSGVIGII